MTHCGICQQFHRGGKKAHVQSCRVCGGWESLLGRIENVDPAFLCPDTEKHRRIVAGFGDESFVAPVVTRRAKLVKGEKGSLRTLPFD